MLVPFFSSNIPLCNEKNPVEKLCNILEMELKMCTPVSPKFVFEKIKFKALDYIQHDFVCQRPGLSNRPRATDRHFHPIFPIRFMLEMYYQQVLFKVWWSAASQVGDPVPILPQIHCKRGMIYLISHINQNYTN